MRVRAEREHDRPGIRELTIEAFGQATEAGLVDALRRNGDAVISLVAVERGGILGHVLFSRLSAPPNCLALAPISVRPDRQRQGIGSKLVREGLARARCRGWSCVVVLGEPRYYGRFGFRLEAGANFMTPYPKRYFMALDLSDGSVVRRGGPVVYPAAFAGLS
jgi:putative acetyltransferase